MNQKLVPFIDDKGVNQKPLHVDPATGVIYYLKKHGGRVIKFSTRCKADQLVKAKRVANEGLAKRLGTKKKSKITALVRDEMPNFIAFKESEDLDESTLVRVRSSIEYKILPFWGEKLVTDLTDDMVLEWVAWYKESFPGETMDNAIKYLRNFCNYLARKRLLPIVPIIRDPNQKAMKRKRKQKTERIFTDEEFKRVYDAGDATQKLAALFMYTMAARIEETLTLRLGSELFLDQDPPIYRWSEGQNKADHEGFHALHPALIKPLERLAIERKAEGTTVVFPQVRDRQKPISAKVIDFNDWRKRAGLGWHWTSKTFRHTCLSRLFSDEKNAQAMIMKLYRVSYRVALETYIKPTESAVLKMRTALEVKL